MTKDEVIANSMWQVTVYAAFQRAKVYTSAATARQKRDLKDYLRELIDSEISTTYEKKVQADTHIRNIQQIRRKINGRFANILDQSSISIGVVQKAFNLSLKLRWCAEQIPMPPHCPLDRVIIDMLDSRSRVPWTSIRDIRVYKGLISKLEEVAGDEALAEWELKNYVRPEA